jgi:hypothetical protein
MKAARLALLPLLVLGAAASSNSPKPIPPTKVENRAALEKLLGNSGMTIQWLSWTSSARGPMTASWKQRALFLKGEHRAEEGSGRVAVEGRVTRINKTEFILNGTITIEDTPDIGRKCQKTGDWKFAITQNRKYWRMREFEWCDQLTDYIDIYF